MMRPDEYGVDRPGSLATHFAGLLQVILAQTLPSLKTPPWSNLWGLNLWAIALPTATAFGRLLCAFTALVSLRIDGSCTFSEHGFNPKDVHVDSRTPSPLRRVELGKDFSLHSDPHSVYDLVDLLIQTGVSECLELIIAWLSPSLREISSHKPTAFVDCPGAYTPCDTPRIHLHHPSFLRGRFFLTAFPLSIYHSTCAYTC